VIERWVAQGGFAGDNIVPPEYRLKKFEGKIYCPTFNFGGDSKAATEVIILLICCFIYYLSVV
jgi:hypothetical protein